uniref:Uncharacterized protein n=1 Tax=Thalassionema nitzschioides TaxID=33649 RepID=A0A7S1E027_9STRA|mmetsp:Transcript_24789/g.36690  ORF Transcript_24789/g.36690 Transcript_24789/m.36690 type:complete len:153 (+) Transcript_24789:105-563(+)
MMAGRMHPLAANLTRMSSAILPASSTTIRHFGKAAKKKRKQKGGGTEGNDRVMNLVLKSLNAPRKKAPEPDEKEAARRSEIVRNYNIGMFNEHNEREHDLACKIALKQHAIKILPRDSYLKEDALKVGDLIPNVFSKRHIPGSEIFLKRKLK